MKWERDYLDKVRPIKLYLLVGVLFDTAFTLRYIAHASVYFLRTRFVLSGRTWKAFRASLAKTWKILRQETWLFLDLEKEARARLKEDPTLRTVIFGHTHQPMNKVFPDGRQYINTGTWTKMTHLDWRRLGQQLRLTFALVRIEGEQARCELREWVGEAGPHRVYTS